MKVSRSAIFLGLGVVLALLAGVLVFVIAQQAAAPKDQAVATTPVVVAKVDIPERTVLSPEQLEIREYPKTLVPAGAITSIDVAARQTTLTKIPIGAPILAGQVVAGGGESGLSLTLEKGKVLVAFPMSDPLTAAGRVSKGDRVDIIGTLAPPSFATTAPAAAGGPAPLTAAALPAFSVTQSIVQNLEVVDIAGKNVLIFIVDHQTALVLKNLRDGGAILDLVIRSRAETVIVGTTPVDTGYIVKTYGFR